MKIINIALANDTKIEKKRQLSNLSNGLVEGGMFNLHCPIPVSLALVKKSMQNWPYQ